MYSVFECDLENIIPNRELLGSEADFFKCTFNSTQYIYKKLYSFSSEKLERFHELMELTSPWVILPMHIVYSDDGKQAGYLLNPLDNYGVIYDLLEYNKNYRVSVLKSARDNIIEMHKLGIIHCDLHSANIMFSGNNTKIIDFDNCFFKGIYPEKNTNCNYSRDYIKINGFSNDVDIYLFNIVTISIMYNIAFDDVFKFSYMFEKKFENSNQEKVWQKVKQKKELTDNDFFINYC